MPPPRRCDAHGGPGVLTRARALCFRGLQASGQVLLENAFEALHRRWVGIAPAGMECGGGAASPHFPQPELHLLRGCLKVLVGCQQRQVIVLAELDEQGINGADLDPSAAADISDFGCCNVVLLVGLKKGEPRKTLYELISVIGACKTLQHFMQHQSSGEDLLGAQESANFRKSWLAITARGQRPEGSIDQQAHRWRSRSAL